MHSYLWRDSIMKPTKCKFSVSRKTYCKNKSHDASLWQRRSTPGVSFTFPPVMFYSLPKQHPGILGEGERKGKLIHYHKMQLHPRWRSAALQITWNMHDTAAGHAIQVMRKFTTRGLWYDHQKGNILFISVQCNTWTISLLFNHVNQISEKIKNRLTVHVIKHQTAFDALPSSRHKLIPPVLDTLRRVTFNIGSRATVYCCVGWVQTAEGLIKWGEKTAGALTWDLTWHFSGMCSLTSALERTVPGRRRRACC